MLSVSLADAPPPYYPGQQPMQVHIIHSACVHTNVHIVVHSILSCDHYEYGHWDFLECVGNSLNITRVILMA